MRGRTRQGGPRPGAIATAGALLLSGCAVFGSDRNAEFRAHIQTPLHPAVAAWALADVCRAEFPSADPNPLHGHVPVVADEDGRFDISLARVGAGRDGYRLAMNGRLPPPRAIRRSGRFDLEPPVFHAGGELTGGGSAADAVRIAVAPSGDGCAVAIELRGEPARGRLSAHLAGVLDVLATCQASGARVEGAPVGDATLARDIEALENATPASCCGAHQRLLSMFHVHRATLCERRDDLPAARAALAAALSSDPEDAGIRARLAALDRRIARHSDSHRHTELLVADPRIGLLRPVLDSRLRNDLHSERDEIGHSADRSVGLLARGDVLGATSWAERARALDGDPDDCDRMAIELHRARGDHRTAFATGVMRLQDAGFDVDLVFQLAEDSVAFGDPASGLRLLARYWDRLDAVATDRVAIAVDRLAGGTGDRFASRIALSEGRTELGLRDLDRWRDTDPTGASLLQRRVALRDRVDTSVRQDALELTPQPFDDAPGVAPMR